MTTSRPTYIEYTPASEHSVYFDAPIMHIFTRKNDSVGEEPSFVAPSPKRDSTIRSTTSLSNITPPERHLDEDTRSASAGVPGHLPVPSFPEPTSELTPETAEPEPKVRDEVLDSTPVAENSHQRTGSVRSADFATLSPTMGSTKKLHKRREGSTSTATATDPDSGYDSPSPRNRAPSLKNADSMQPLPVVWADGVDHGPEDALELEKEHGQRSRSVMSRTPTNITDVRRSQSMRSYRTAGTTFGDRDYDGQNSIRTTPSGRRTPSGTIGRRKSMNGGSFANGAGTIGPAAAADEDETRLFRARSVTAETSLTKKQKVKLGKAESKLSFCV
jgi:hypothetical protein